jgi:hypothetical protein
MRRLLILLPLLLGACGDLPQPFLGRPGATAMRLANQPPPARLAVPAPGTALLGDKAAAAWASDVAKALQDKEVPATEGRTSRGDWSLALTARVRGRTVVPAYEVLNPQGKGQGSVEGAPVPLAAWAQSDPATLRASAEAAAPQLADLLNRIQAARLKADPNSLVNRSARLYFTGVTGAPGDGNHALAMQMRSKLAGQGIVVQDTPTGADFQLDGKVVTASGTGGQERIEVQWVVQDAQGRERGRVAQLNEVPPEAVANYWGDVAVAVAEQAASGVAEVLTQAGATHPGPARPAAPASASTAVPAGSRPRAGLQARP